MERENVRGKIGESVGNQNDRSNESLVTMLRIIALTVLKMRRSQFWAERWGLSEFREL
jgi:hypothetical protein